MTEMRVKTMRHHLPSDVGGLHNSHSSNLRCLKVQSWRALVTMQKVLSDRKWMSLAIP